MSKVSWTEKEFNPMPGDVHKFEPVVYTIVVFINSSMWKPNYIEIKESEPPRPPREIVLDVAWQARDISAPNLWKGHTISVIAKYATGGECVMTRIQASALEFLLQQGMEELITELTGEEQ